MDLIPLTVTLLCCLLISLEYGILIGIATNVIFVLYSSARPKLDVERLSGDIYVVKLKTGLHFSAAEYVRENILETCTSVKSIVIIDGKYVGNIDATVAKSFSVLQEELALRDQKLIFVNFKKSVIDTCLGVNKELSQYFRENLEQVVEVPINARRDDMIPLSI